jgi:hypothetical protein
MYSFKNKLVNLIDLFSIIIKLLVIIIAFSFSGSFFERIISENCKIKKISNAKWLIDIDSLNIGEYYISLGRPRTACQIMMNNQILDSSYTSGLRLLGKLSVGSSFIIDDQSIKKNIEINCEETGGFGVKLTHDPIVSKYRSGVLLQLWRIFLDVVLGPIFSLILIVLILFQSNFSRNLKTEIVQNIVTGKHYTLFAIISFLYSLSLSYITRLFISDEISTLIHIFLRILFSMVTVYLFSIKVKINKIIYIFHFTALLLLTFVYFESIENIRLFYQYLYPLFPISLIYIIFNLFRKNDQSEMTHILISLNFVWILVLIFDGYKLIFLTGSFLSPVILACITLFVGYLKVKENNKAQRIEISSTRILSAIESKSPVREILTQLASIVSGDTHFSRVSAYIDGFCLGFAEHPGVVYYRVMESGYQKNTVKDERIDFQEGRGTYMFEAIQKGEMVLRKSQRDDAWFIVVPLGKHACLNLSDSRPVSPYSAYESEELLKRLLPSLRTLNDKLIEHGMRQGFALEKLRSAKGDGKFDVEIGALFADINSYSTYTERYGTSFSDFVTAIYLPAMIKNLSKWVVPEFVRGDEIYFLSIKDLLKENDSTADAILNAAHELEKFTYNEGANLCKQNGFEPLTLSVGIAHGPAVLICDSIKVRTSGQTVNEAKRLQESAGKGETLVHVSLKALTENKGFKFGEEFPVLVKKNFIMAVKLQKNSLKNAS